MDRYDEIIANHTNKHNHEIPRCKCGRFISKSELAYTSNGTHVRWVCSCGPHRRYIGRP